MKILEANLSSWEIGSKEIDAVLYYFVKHKKTGQLLGFDEKSLSSSIKKAYDFCMIEPDYFL